MHEYNSGADLPQNLPQSAEFLRTSLEIPPLSHPERALLAALTPPEELRSKWHTMFTPLVEAQIHLQITPDRKRLYTAAAEMIEWEWFGEPTAPLPDSLTLYTWADEETLDINYKPHIPLRANETDKNILTELKEHLRPISEEREAFFMNNEDMITAAVEDVIRTGPAYGLLQALLIETPNLYEEKPLTHNQKILRHSQASAHVSAISNIPPNEPITPFSDMYTTFTKEHGRVEMETALHKNKNVQTAREKVHAWLLQEAQDKWLPPDADKRGERVTEIMYTSHEPHKYNNLHIRTNTHQVYDIDDTVYTWSSSRCRGIDYPFAMGHYDAYLLSTFVRHMYETAPDVPVTDVLEQAVHDHAYHIVNENILDTTDVERRVLQNLRRPTGTIYTKLLDTPILKKVEATSPDTTITIHSRERAQSDKQRSIAQVRYRDHTESTYRLILQQDILGTYPEITDSYDLAIDFNKKTGFGYPAGDYFSTEPYIPGFTVVARKEGTWYFARSETDPYQGSEEVLIDEAGKQRLIGVYRERGLFYLARALEQRTTCSAAELAQIIREESDYTYAITLATDSTPQEDSLLSHFSSYIVHGRLQVQCTGAASFLASSLDIALPGCRTRTVGGQVLINQETLPAAGHAQTVLSYQGQDYLLDATPKDRTGVSVVNHTNRYAPYPLNNTSPHDIGRQGPTHTSATKTPATQDMTIDLPTTTIADIMQKTTPMNRTTTKEQLEDMLQIVFNVHTQDDLYRKIDRLGMADPVRLALKTIVKLSDQTEHHEIDISHVRTFLQQCIDSEPDKLKKHHIPRYDPQLLRLILHTLSSLS